MAVGGMPAEEALSINSDISSKWFFLGQGSSTCHFKMMRLMAWLGKIGRGRFFSSENGLKKDMHGFTPKPWVELMIYSIRTHPFIAFAFKQMRIMPPDKLELNCDHSCKSDEIRVRWLHEWDNERNHNSFVYSNRWVYREKPIPSWSPQKNERHLSF